MGLVYQGILWIEIPISIVAQGEHMEQYMESQIMA